MPSSAQSRQCEIFHSCPTAPPRNAAVKLLERSESLSVGKRKREGNADVVLPYPKTPIQIATLRSLEEKCR